MFGPLDCNLQTDRQFIQTVHSDLYIQYIVSTQIVERNMSRVTVFTYLRNKELTDFSKSNSNYRKEKYLTHSLTHTHQHMNTQNYFNLVLFNIYQISIILFQYYKQWLYNFHEGDNGCDKDNQPSSLACFCFTLSDFSSYCRTI